MWTINSCDIDKDGNLIIAATEPIGPEAPIMTGRSVEVKISFENLEKLSLIFAGWRPNQPDIPEQEKQDASWVPIFEGAKH